MRHSSTIMAFYSFLVAVELSLAFGQQQQQRVFYQLTDPTKTLKYTDTTDSRVDSPATCAVTCVSLNAACNSFLYNNQEGLCSYGYWGWMQTTNHHRNLSNELAFWSPGCHAVKSYKQKSNQMEKICFWFSDQKDNYAVNYTTAKFNCEGRGLQLVTLKTTQKLTLFKGVANGTAVDQAWIGVDNLPNESSFHWVDNSAIEDDVRREMSLSGPSQKRNGQCVAYDPKSWSFNDDDDCSVLKNYICEIILP